MTKQELEFISDEVNNQECPFCSERHEVLIDVRGEYPNAVFFPKSSNSCSQYNSYLNTRILQLHQVFMTRDLADLLTLPEVTL